MKHCRQCYHCHAPFSKSAKLAELSSHALLYFASQERLTCKPSAWEVRSGCSCRTFSMVNRHLANRDRAHFTCPATGVDPLPIGGFACQILGSFSSRFTSHILKSRAPENLLSSAASTLFALDTGNYPHRKSFLQQAIPCYTMQICHDTEV